ncbi:putative ribonuclease H-like domain-containing protein [Tanacetum coccineum]
MKCSPSSMSLCMELFTRIVKKKKGDETFINPISFVDATLQLRCVRRFEEFIIMMSCMDNIKDLTKDETKYLKLFEEEIEERLKHQRKMRIWEMMDDPNITIEEYIMLEEEKAQKRSKVFNWETAKYGKIWYDEDIRDLRSLETEFPDITFNDGVSSEKTLSYEPTISSLNDEIDFRNSFDDSDDEDYTVIFDKNSFSYKVISTNDLKTDSENVNEKVNMPSLSPPEPTVSCFDDLDFFKDFENEFSAIVYNDAQTSKSESLTEPILSPQHIDEFDLNDKTSLSEYDEEEQNVLYFNDLFPYNIIHPDDLKSEKENDDNEVDIIQSLGEEISKKEPFTHREEKDKKLLKPLLLQSAHSQTGVNMILRRLRMRKYFHYKTMHYGFIENGNSFKPADSNNTNADEYFTRRSPNLKFLRSLPSEWNTHVVIWRNKPNLDTMSFDDRYNNFNIVEQEVKRTSSSSSSSSSQKLDFVSSPNSTNEVNTAYGVSTANTQISLTSTQVSTASTQVSTANLSNATVYAFLANQPNRYQLIHEDLEQIHEYDLEEMDLKWQLALLSMRTRRFFQKTGRKITIKESDTTRYDKSKPEFEGYIPKTSKSVSKDISNEVKESVDALLVEELVSDDKLEKKTVFPTVAKTEFVRPKKQEKPVKKPVKYAEMYRLTAITIKGKGLYMEYKTRWNYNYSAKKAHPSAHRNMVPKAVLMKTGLRPLNTARPVNTAHPKTINIGPKESLTCLVAKATLDESMLWHRRLGHVKFKIINKPVKENLVRGLPTKHFENDQTCVACLKGKQHKASSYLLGFSFFSTKDETRGILKSFITKIENLVDKKVKIIRCDNETEFKNRVMSEFCKNKGIKKEFSVARTLQQNGVAKSRNRTLIKAARTMLADFKLPTTFWAEVVNTACYVRIRCHVTILNTLHYLGKVDEKLDEGFFVGYLMNSKAFGVYNIRTRKVEENLHIRFLEDKPIIAGDGLKWLFDIDVLTKSMNYVLVVAGTNSNDLVDGSLFDSSSKNASNDEPQPPSDARKKDDEGVYKESGIDDQERPENNTQDVNIDGPSINTKPDMFSLGDNATLEATHADFFGDETELNMRNITTTYLVPSTLNIRIYKDHSLDHVIGDEEPKRIAKALSDSAWVEAMQEELLQFKLQKVWVLVDLPKEEGIDYDEVFAPVARIEAIRLFLAYASFMGFMVYQMDVKSAFLYGRIEEEVYVCQPLGFEDPDYPDKVYKVVKALYGLHQAPRAWYETLAKYLLDNGFYRGKIDQTLFIKKQKGDILLVHVYVDDIIFGSTKKELCTEFEKLMHDKFQMSSMGELTFFLGLQVKQKEDGIFISQDKYVADILRKFSFTDVRTASTLMDTEKPLLKDSDGDDVDVHLYRSMIGSLMYLTSSRPDIMFAVCACARFQVTPKVSHLHAVKRIFRYLKGQPKLGLWYPRDSSFDLVAYSDSDYAGASLDRKSTIGAEYVAAASCCGQVLWIQNQMLDYGYNFMNTKIFIDNESTICIVKNLVFHSKTKHIEIRHHFIRDSNEKKLIQMIDVGRFQYQIASIGILNL